MEIFDRVVLAVFVVIGILAAVREIAYLIRRAAWRFEGVLHVYPKDGAPLPPTLKEDIKERAPYIKEVILHEEGRG